MELVQDIQDNNYDNVKSKSQNFEKWSQMMKYVDNEGMNPLHHVCKKGDIKTAKLIISKLPDNFDIDAKEKTNGHTALVLSLYSHEDGEPDIIEALLEKNANPQVQDLKGNTAFHHSAGSSQGDVLELLLKRKNVNINLPNNDGETPLHIAIKESQMYSFQLLLKHNADIHVKNHRGEGPMHYAVLGIGNAVHYVTYLQKEGLSIDDRDSNGRTPLMHLALSGKPKDHRVVQILLKLGAKLDAEDNEKISAKEMFESGSSKKQLKKDQKDGRVGEKKEELKQRSGKQSHYYIYFLVPFLLIVLAKVLEKSFATPAA